MCLAICNNLLLVLQDAPKRFFSTNSRSSVQPKIDAKTIFFFTLHPLSTVIFATATVLAFVLLRDSRFSFHFYTQREATPTQKSARKCAATSRDFLRERLQSAFTLANQLRWIAQYLHVVPLDWRNARQFESHSAVKCLSFLPKLIAADTFVINARVSLRHLMVLFRISQHFAQLLCF